MSSRRVAAALIVAAVAGRPGAAQSPDTRALARRADSLLALWRDANTLAQVQLQLRQARQQRAGDVTRSSAAVLGQHPVQAGHLMVVATEPDSIPLREAARLAWAALEATYGHVADSLTAHPIKLVVVTSAPRRTWDSDDRRVTAHLPLDELGRILVSMVGEPLTDARFSRWLGGRVQAVLDTARSRSDAYLQLAVGSRSGRACFGGDLAQCAVALELNEDSTFYLAAFDVNERRAAVVGSRPIGMVDAVEQVPYRRCVDQRVDSACVAFLSSLGRDQVPRPLTEDARNLLVATALDLGGPGAYDRLMADSMAAITARLARAAGGPIDTVVARWRSAILSARPSDHGIPLSGALFTVGWVALLATAAVRSTRWRLG